LNRGQIIRWRDKYDLEEDFYNKTDESELRNKFQAKLCISMVDLERVVRWKFQGRLEGRQKRIMKMLKNADSEYVEKVSGLAFEIQSDELRIKLLCTIKGVGPALASTILTFYDADKYGVFDIHAWREMFKEKEPKDLFSNPKHLMKFISRLRAMSEEEGLPCRDIEKALFKKNKDLG
jgi:hypothetical protein